MFDVRYTAWIPPKKGGSDYTITGQVIAATMATATKIIIKTIRKEGSAVLDDYRITSVNSGKVF
jgi:hypothetical protein